ncbi:MAG: carboxypeptidase-like regulatory domain-containing protein [Lysobacterales bacterium]
MRTFLAEFLFSAVLWGSLITWGLWRWRKHAQRGIARKLLVLPLFWFALHTAFAWYGFVLPPSGRLVDDTSGKPIPNMRVEVRWGAYPVLASIGYCPGFQAHLTDGDGTFSFPFVPMPTLFLGTLYRGLNPVLPGRVRNGRVEIFPVWLSGEIRIRHYQPGRAADDSATGAGCKNKFLPQHWGGLLRGEPHPFEVLYKEGCIEKKPWSYTNAFLREMNRLQSQPRRSTTQHAMPPEIVRLIREELGNKFCPDVRGPCVYEVGADVHDRFCEYFESVYDDSGRTQ